MYTFNLFIFLHLILFVNVYLYILLCIKTWNHVINHDCFILLTAIPLKVNKKSPRFIWSWIYLTKSPYKCIQNLIQIIFSTYDFANPWSNLSLLSKPFEIFLESNCFCSKIFMGTIGLALLYMTFFFFNCRPILTALKPHLNRFLFHSQTSFKKTGLIWCLQFRHDSSFIHLRG